MLQFCPMVGTIINAAAILFGGLAGLATRKQPSPNHQAALKVLLGAFTVYVGLSGTWRALNGSFGMVVKQLTVVVLALTLGNLCGKALRIQKALNRLGQYAKQRLLQPAAAGRGDGFVTCTILFCLTPLAVLGSLEDGLSGNFKVLIVKAAMDGLAIAAFATTFGSGALLSVIPVLAFQGSLTLLAQSARPWLAGHNLADPVSATAGLLVFCVALIILGLKKVELADYLPSLVFAALIAWVWP